MANIVKIKSQSTTWGDEANSINANFGQLNELKVEKENGSRLITSEEVERLETLQAQVQSNLSETDEELPSYVKGKEEFNEKIEKSQDEKTDTKLALLYGEFITPTLTKVPTPTTLMYLVGEVEHQFKVGQLCRVIVNGEPKFYRLSNLMGLEAVWEEEGTGGGSVGPTGDYASGFSWWNLQDPKTIMPLTGVSFSKPSVNYVWRDGNITGDEVDLNTLLVYTPEDASDKEVSFITNDSELVVVNGVITKIPTSSNGTYEITVTSLEGSFTDTINVNVTLYVPVTSVNIIGGDISLDIPDTKQLDVTVNPSNATVKVVNYLSLDTQVCTVDSNGLITPIKNGDTSIKVISEDNPTISHQVEIDVFTSVKSLTLSKAEVELTFLGDTDIINADISPITSNIGTNLEWTSSDDTIVTIVKDTGVPGQVNYGFVTAIKAGTCIITCTNRTLSATCNVTVTI